MDIQFVNYDIVFLEKSYFWLTDPEVKQLTASPEIKKEEQYIWYETLSERTDYKIWGVVADAIPVGAVGIKHIDIISGTAEYFGYIGEKKFWGKGIGKKMLNYVEKEARELKINVLFLKVWDKNVRATNLYRKSGYIEYKKEERSILMKKTLDNYEKRDKAYKF